MNGRRTQGIRRGRVSALAALVVAGLLVPVGTTAASAADGASRPRASGSALATLEVDAPTVEVKPSGKSSFVTAASGRELKAGDTVRTSATGSAQINYADGSLTRLDVSTEYKLVKLSDTKGTRKTKGIQSAGQTWHRVQKLTGSDTYSVEGANTTAAVLGTAFVVKCVARNQCTFTAVIDDISLTPGSVPKTSTKTVTLTPGDQATVEDSAIGPVTTLTQEDLLAIAWITQNLLADQQAGKSPGTSELGSQPDPPPTRPKSTPIATPPPPPPAGNAGTGTGTGTGTPANRPPVAVDDSYTMPEDTLLVIAAPGVLGNDTDPESNPLEAFLASLPVHGSLTFNADGSFVYFPDANFNGTDSFQYVVGDGQYGSAPATVTITVNPVNDAPVAVNDAYSTPEDTQLVVAAPGVLTNDTDVDSGSLSAVLGTTPGHSSAFALHADGSFTYTPDANYNGPDSFTYTASDGTASSAPVTVAITVNPVNDAPVAVNDAYNIDEEATLTVPSEGTAGVLANDTDAEGDPLTATLVDPTANGTLTFHADGTFMYVPNANFNGTDSFTYRASDGTATSNLATVTITVNPVNDAPVAVADEYSTDAGETLVVDAAAGVLHNDSDVDNDPLTAVQVTGHEGDGPDYGSLTLNADGSFTYTPDEGFTGTDHFTYVASDGSAQSDPVTVTIDVPAPTGEAQTHSMTESGDNIGFITAHASTITITSLPDEEYPDYDGPDREGDLTYLGNAVTVGQVIPADATLVYTPTVESAGTSYWFTWTANSGAVSSDPVVEQIDVV